jgi:hypothetical protein
MLDMLSHDLASWRWLRIGAFTSLESAAKGISLVTKLYINRLDNEKVYHRHLRQQKNLTELSVTGVYSWSVFGKYCQL